MITIIDYGMSNLASIRNMLSKLHFGSVITADISLIKQADKLIIPGVGAFDNAVSHLRERNLIEVLNEKIIIEKKPVLGICLGMQLFTNKSEEGVLPGLGWINGKTIRFKFDPSQTNMKVPHMGWNEITIKRNNYLLGGFEEQPRFYFVHSYYLKPKNSEDVIATSTHGIEFTAAVNKDNIWGTQFHPEKSHKFGLKVMKNFCDI